MIEVFLIAFALSMDCFTVSVAYGAIIKKPKKSQAIKIALFFGFFQLFMPLLGWTANLSFHRFISQVDHWVAFGLLLAIGIKMIYEAFKKKSEEEELKKKKNLMSMYTLLLLAIATSIDALAVGLSFRALGYPVLISAIIIGATSFSISLLGVYIGKKIGHIVKNKIELVGGIILIGIGIKIILENTS
jgi:manganese efflux pump family protein